MPTNFWRPRLPNSRKGKSTNRYGTGLSPRQTATGGRQSPTTSAPARRHCACASVTSERARASRAVDSTPAGSAHLVSTGRRKAADGKRRSTKLNASYGIALVATCAGIVWAVMLLYVSLGRTAPQETAAAVAPVNRSEPSVRADAAAKAVKSASDSGTQRRSSSELIARIDELRLADNWNVLVLYATEWTRLESGNAAAWNQLSLGFEKLRQYDDAYAAATKAVSLAPKEPLYWRNLGELDRELNLPEEALRAYGEASALNDKDIHSLVQVGLLNLRLARMPEARLALDKALAANPEDPEVVCLKAVVARPPTAPKELPAAAKHLESLTGSCRDFAERRDQAVVANSSNATKSAVVPRKP
jgi:tetratricopeptide (TPR) repeat protein